MKPPRLARRLLRALLPDAHRDVVLGDLDEEFDRHVSRSRSAVGARAWYWRQAMRSIGPALRLRARGGAGIGRDARYAGRILRRSPGFALVVTLTLSLGVAATTAVVSVAHAVLLRPLPYADPDRLIAVAEVDTTREAASSGNVSLPDYLDYATRNHTLASIAGYTGGSRTINFPDAAVRVASAEVTDGFFRTLGVWPALGRDFVTTDMPATAPLVAIIGHRTWALRFNGDPSIVGRSISLSGIPVTVVGVLPESFEFPLRGLAELWLPIRPSPAQVERGYFHWFDVIARLKPGVAPADAAADLTAIARTFPARDPRYHASSAVRVATLQQKIVGDARPILLILVGAAACLLLVACANLGGLLVTRASARRHDADIRIALGASRGQLARQQLVEMLVLTTPALALGAIGGQWLVRLFVAAMPLAQRAALPSLLELTIDPRALAVSTVTALLIAALFGLVPAWRAAQTGAAAQRRGVVGFGREQRARAWLVGIETALALVLISGSALLIASLHNLLAVPAGFNPEGLLTYRISVGGARYRDPSAVRAFHALALDRMRLLPGVTGAATISQLPLGGPGGSGVFTIQDDASRADRPTLVRTISETYFDVMQIPMQRGRAFAAGDRPGAPRVVIVNRLAADTLFDGDAVGRQIAFQFVDGQPWHEVVGIVGNERFDSLEGNLRPVVYFPYQQSLDGGFSVVVRTRDGAEALGPMARAAISQIDPALPIFLVQTMDQILSESPPVFRRRSVLALMGLFAAAALALAAIGLYGIVAQSVAERTREIGVRMSLGATRADIARDVVSNGLTPALAGAAIGIAGSVGVARVLDALLFGVTPAGAVPMIGGATAVLLAAALLACAIPARRATRIDPIRALRAD